MHECQSCNERKVLFFTQMKLSEIVIGGVYNNLTVIKDLGGKNSKHRFLCKCNFCGKELDIKGYHIGVTTACRGCANIKPEDNLTGRRIGHLTVLGYAGRWRHGHSSSSLWRCKCDCGNIKNISRASLMRGQDNCGCERNDKLKKINTKHGCCRSSLYAVWCGMKARCNNPNNKSWKDYGGRGISVCTEWEDNFVPFKNWALSHGYDKGLSIDRINVNGNYEPSNCRWVTPKEQSNNRRNNKMIELNGIIHTLSEWCGIYNIKPHLVSNRIRRGWSVLDAITKPKRTKCISE